MTNRKQPKNSEKLSEEDLDDVEGGAELRQTSTDDEQAETYLQYKLKDVKVTSYSFHGSGD